MHIPNTSYKKEENNKNITFSHLFTTIHLIHTFWFITYDWNMIKIYWDMNEIGCNNCDVSYIHSFLHFWWYYDTIQFHPYSYIFSYFNVIVMQWCQTINIFNIPISISGDISPDISLISDIEDIRDISGEISPDTDINIEIHII